MFCRAFLFFQIMAEKRKKTMCFYKRKRKNNYFCSCNLSPRITKIDTELRFLSEPQFFFSPNLKTIQEKNKKIIFQLFENHPHRAGKKVFILRLYPAASLLTRKSIFQKRTLLA